MASALFSIIILVVQQLGSCEDRYGPELGVWYPVMNNYGAMASLHTSLSVFGVSTHRCGATLISERHLLTAASCMTKNGSDRLVGISLGRINLGLNQLSRNDKYKIKEVFVHPDFENGIGEYNDIAILRTDRKVKFHDKVYPYCLPERNQVFYPSSSVKIMGWGYLSLTHKASQLQEGYLKLVDPHTCVSLWREHALEDYNNVTHYKYPQGIDDRLACAYRPGVSASIGDSGGPMTYQNYSGRHTVIAVIPEVTEIVMDIKTPQLFTNIVAYVDWIYASTGLSADLLTKGCGIPPWMYD